MLLVAPSHAFICTNRARVLTCVRAYVSNYCREAFETFILYWRVKLTRSKEGEFASAASYSLAGELNKRVNECKCVCVYVCSVSREFYQP